MGDQYWNHSQNLILFTTFQIVEKQKEFTSTIAKEFAYVFTTQISKLVEIIKVQKKMI